jgi:hypothetical protein
VGQFYAFELKTAAMPQRANWNATAIVGGASFPRPQGRNRDAEPAPDRPRPGRQRVAFESRPLKATLDAQWLSGAIAAEICAAVEVRFSPRPTRFTRNTDFMFDDPARSFMGADRALRRSWMRGRHADLKRSRLPREVRA